MPWSFGALIVTFAVLLAVLRNIPAALLPSFGIMGLVLAPVLGREYARRAGLPVAPAMTGPLLSYLIALPPLHGGAIAYLRSIGPSGIFLALLVAGAYAVAARRIKNGWFACALTVALFAALHAAHVDLVAFITALLAPLGRLGDTYAALMLIVLVETLLWCIGMHGPALLAAVLTPVYLTLQMQNTQAYAHHEPLPHIVVVSLFLFVFPGGAGATFPLAALLAFSRVPRLRTIGRATILPALFNTNEPLLFAVPVVLNPFLAVPFVVAPLVLATTTYAAVAAGLVGRPVYYVPSSIPTLVSTYVATLDPRAVALAAVNLLLAALIYYPFVRAYERHASAGTAAAAA